MKQRIAFLIIITTTLASTLGAGCDPAKSQKSTPQTTRHTATQVPEPVVVEARAWAATPDATTYEVRQLPDGNPGIFTADGALLLQLVPELLVDVAPAGKSRIKPAHHAFNVVRLERRDDGGLSLFARTSDRNARAYDLRIEKGPGDPRVHMEVSTTWSRDVEVHRLVVGFRTGQQSSVHGLTADYEWVPETEEWIPPAHTPTRVRIGDGDAMLTAMGRSGTEGVGAHKSEDETWAIEFEMYHYDNHPLELGDRCDATDLGGAARFEAGESLTMRADFVLGEANVPLVTRFPDGRRAAISIIDPERPGAPMVLRLPSDELTAPEPALWVGALQDAPCSEERPRFAGLAAQGHQFIRVGTMETADGNLLSADEADARRVVFFQHPAAQTDDTALRLFRTTETDSPPAAWLREESIDSLRKQWGLAVWEASMEPLLASDASATQSVRDRLGALSDDATLWVASAAAVGDHVLASAQVDIDMLPDGVMRVRNPGSYDLTGVSLKLPDGVHARVDGETGFDVDSSIATVDLPAGGARLLQLFRGDEPYSPIEPANLAWTFEPTVEPTE